MQLSPGVDRTHNIPHNRLIRRQGEPLALDMIYDLKLIFILPILILMRDLSNGLRLSSIVTEKDNICIDLTAKNICLNQLEDNLGRSQCCQFFKLRFACTLYLC